jgi:shikimate kinase
MAVRIYLIGYMASGKSNLGRKLAPRLGYGFVDLDELFEERFKISVLDFFEKYDEQAFRNIERHLLLETREMQNIVVSTGGGSPCYFDNLSVIKSAGISVYLEWDVPALVNRLNTIRRKRPLLKDIPAPGLAEKIESDLSQRNYFYRQADFTIQGESFDEDKLVALLRARISNPETGA